MFLLTAYSSVTRRVKVVRERLERDFRMIRRALVETKVEKNLMLLKAIMWIKRKHDESRETLRPFKMKGKERMRICELPMMFEAI